MGFPLRLYTAETKSDLDQIRILFREYQEELAVDLCFQSFEEELDSLPGKYALPEGMLLLAEWENQIAGCIALRPMSSDCCEMKRLYVRPSFKGKGIGRFLAERVLEEAPKKGYKRMRLDTLEKLTPAISLYIKLGFQEITAYYPNPLDGVVYMEKVF